MQTAVITKKPVCGAFADRPDCLFKILCRRLRMCGNNGGYAFSDGPQCPSGSGNALRHLSLSAVYGSAFTAFSTTLPLSSSHSNCVPLVR